MQLAIHMIYIWEAQTQLAFRPGHLPWLPCDSVEVSFTSKNWRSPVLQLKESIRTAATLRIRLSISNMLGDPSCLTNPFLAGAVSPSSKENLTILDWRDVLA
jgi:hypothetical protein